METFIELFEKGTKNKLVETVINTLKDIIRYVQVDEQEYNKAISNVSLYSSMLTNPIDKKQFVSNMKRVKEIRNKYLNMIKFNNGTIDLYEVVSDVIAMEAENQLKEKKGGRKGNSVIINGVEYKNIKDAAEKLNTSRSQIYRMLK